MRTDRDAGFTIIEVLIAIFILGILMGSVMWAITANLRTNANVNNRAEAVRAAEIMLENYRQRTDYGALNVLGSETVTQAINGRNYSVESEFCSADRPSDIKSKFPCSDTATYIGMKVKFGDKVLNSVSTYFTKFGRTDDSAE